MIDVIPVHTDIDKILSYEGGLVRGAMYEVYGPDGEGKSTLAILVAIAAQRIGLKVGWMDVEYSFNSDHARFFGLNFPEEYQEEGELWNYFAPLNGEEAMDKVDEWCKEGYGLIVVDSVGGLVPKAVDEAEHIGDSRQFAQVASLLAQSLPKIRKSAHYGNTAIMFLNQIRAKFIKFGVGPPTESFGGYTLKHTVSARFEIRKVAWIKYSTDTIGFKLRIRAPKKNRFAPPNRDGYLDIICSHDAPSLEDINKRRKIKIETISQKEDE